MNPSLTGSDPTISEKSRLQGIAISNTHGLEISFTVLARQIILKSCFIAVGMFALFSAAMPRDLPAQGRESLEKTAKDDITFVLERNLKANYFRTDTSLGGIFTSGNVEQISVEGKSATQYRIKRFLNQWDVGGYYNRKFFDSEDPDDPPETIARYIYGFYRMDYFFTQNTTLFVGGGGYSDQVKGIPLGARGFIGVSHYFIWTEKTALKLSGGYEFVGEERDPPDPRRILNTAKVELGYQQKLNANVGFLFHVDSLKSFTDLDQWLINGDVQFQVKLYKLLSLFCGFTVRFDNVPTTGFRKLDTITNLSLGVSFESPKAKPKKPLVE